MEELQDEVTSRRVASPGDGQSWHRRSMRSPDALRNIVDEQETMAQAALVAHLLPEFRVEWSTAGRCWGKANHRPGQTHHDAVKERGNPAPGADIAWCTTLLVNEPVQC